MCIRDSWYGEDIGHVNSKLLIERGYGPYDTGAITSEFCKRAAGRVNPEIIKNLSLIHISVESISTVPVEGVKGEFEQWDS